MTVEVEATGLEGLVVLNRHMHVDSRGSFSRLFSTSDLDVTGQRFECLQVNHSVSNDVGTLRGMHFQYPPFGERKLVACVVGAIWDAVVDLRPWSATYLKHFSTELRGNDGRSLLVPEGFAHGFVTLEPTAHVVYVSSQGHAPGSEDGIRYDDDLIGIPWPVEPLVVSDKDLRWTPLAGRRESIGARLAEGRS